MLNLPVSFTQEIQGNSNNLPYQIKASDLDKDFVFAALDADNSLIEQTTGQGGHPARKLKIPAVPQSGTYVLGAISGSLEWLSTEEC